MQGIHLVGYRFATIAGIIFLLLGLLAASMPVSSVVAADPQPVQLWAAVYDGTGNDEDVATSLAVDGSGNVYVTGYSRNTDDNCDYATVKYNSDGVQQWAAVYNGTGNYDDYATSLAVDGSGNVYVTGSAQDEVGNADYVTIKYNSDGVQQWVAIYDGTDNGYDYATSLAVDSSGNVYVTGSTWNAVTNDDYATVKYNSDGVQQWVAIYDGTDNGYDYATSLAVDSSGNVYVTGYSYNAAGNKDYATVMYNSNSVQQWAAIYNGTGNDHDSATSLAVDGSGNVYVTGYSRNTDDNWDYATVKYNSDGVQQWAAVYNGTGNDHDSATSLAVDGSGNVYVTGDSRNADGYSDYVTVKYNSNGVQQWVAIYNGTDNGNDYANSLAVDGSGNVYVTGDSRNADGYSDYVTVKYNSDGVQQWAAVYNGTGNYDDMATSLAVDGSGNVYVTGDSRNADGNDDYVTVKYRIQSSDSGDGDEPSNWKPWPTPTPNPNTGEGYANPTVGGQMASRDGRVTVQMPGGSVDRLVKLWYEKFCASEIAPPSGWSYVGCPFDLRAVDAGDERINLHQFKMPAQLTVHYSDSDAYGLDENSFQIAYYDGAQWVRYPSVVDAQSNSVTAEVNHFSLHALLGSSDPVDSVISGRVFYDRDGDGVFNGDDFPVAKAGVKISSYDWYAQHTTDAMGLYSFPCLRNSSYTVKLEVGPEWEYTTPPEVNNISVDGSAGSRRTDVDFGIRWLLR